MKYRDSLDMSKKNNGVNRIVRYVSYRTVSSTFTVQGPGM